MRLAVILVVSCLALSGCTVVTFDEMMTRLGSYELAPPLHGVLEKDGKPVCCAVVRTIYNGRSSSKVCTDAQGRFRTEAVEGVGIEFPVRQAKLACSSRWKSGLGRG